MNTNTLPAFISPLNNKGQVAGMVRRPGADSIPVVWTNGVPTVLPVPAGFTLIALKAINDAGQVVGQIQPNNTGENASQVVIWNGTVPTILPHDFDLANCPGSDQRFSISNAFGINRAGHVAGETLARVGNNVCSALSWIWDGSKFSALPVQRGSCGQAFSVAEIPPFGINDADHVVTSLFDTSPVPGQFCNQRAAIIVPGKPLSQLAVPDGYVGDQNTGNHINNLDQTYGVGQSGTTAFFWDGVRSVELTAPGSILSVNNLGQALVATRETVPFSIWQNGTRTGIPTPSGLTFGDPAGLNDAGQIAISSVVQRDFSELGRIAVLTPSGGCSTEVSAQVTVNRGGFRLNRVTGHYTQTVTVTNHSGSAIGAPVSVVFDSVPDSATLYGLSGATGCVAPMGSPFITVQSGLAANGGSASVTLDFINTSNAAVTYSTRVLAGPGIR